MSSSKWKVVKTFNYKDFNINCTEYQHESGLRHIHADMPSNEMSFNMVFETNPVDDTGMPHVLEHLTLSGSKQFPVKDPFMSMSGRTLAHSMNAGTGRTNTQYYFSTTADKDFQNLAKLYSDLVFNPILEYKDFLREAWRLEFDENGNPSTSGVVFNEMKGSYSDQMSEYSDTISRVLDPDSCHGLSSGGNPAAVTTLSFNRLKQYHNECYAPSKGLLITAGQFDLNVMHDNISGVIDLYKPFDDIGQDPEWLDAVKSFRNIKLPTAQTPEGVTILRVPPGPNDSMILSSLNIMVDDDGFDDVTKEAAISCADAYMESKFQLNKEARDLGLNIGFSTAKRKHSSGKNSIVIVASCYHDENFNGIDFLKRTISDAINNITEEDVEIEKDGMIKDVKRSASDLMPSQLAGMIKKACIEGREKGFDDDTIDIASKIKFEDVKNVFKSWDFSKAKIIQAVADKKIPELRDKMIDDILAIKMAVMTEDQKKELMLLSNSWRDQPERANVNSLPSMTESDIAEITPKTRLPVETISGDVVINYVKEDSVDRANITLSFDLSKLPHNLFKDIQALPLLLKSIPTSSASVDDLNYFENENNISLSSGTQDLMSTVEDSIETVFNLSCSTDKDNIDLIPDYLMSRIFDADLSGENRIKQKVKMYVENPPLESSRSKLSLMNMATSAMFSKKDMLRLNTTKTQEEVMHKFVDEKYAVSRVAKLLEELKKCPVRINVIGDENIKLKAIELSKRPELVPSQSNKIKFTDHPLHSELKHPAKNEIYEDAVNTCFRSMKGPNPDQSLEHVSMLVGLEMLSPLLHEEVREKGGAYGSSVSLNGGSINFSSYRDPNLDETFDAFDKVSEKLLSNDWTEQDLLGAKIRLSIGLLSPMNKIAMANYSLSRFELGFSDDYEKEMFNKISSVKVEDVKKYASKWFSKNNEYIQAALISSTYDLSKSKLIVEPKKAKDKSNKATVV